jgi:hypothetical protein
VEHAPGPEEESTPIPRWAQIVAGIVLLPIALLCVVGAVSIFGIPKVRADPLLQLFAGFWSVLCIWALVLAIRLILGIRGRYGFFGPVALRISAAVAIGLVIGGLFTGIYVEHPVRGTLLAVAYAIGAAKLWRLAARRSGRAA